MGKKKGKNPEASASHGGEQQGHQPQGVGRGGPQQGQQQQQQGGGPPPQRPQQGPQQQQAGGPPPQRPQQGQPQQSRGQGGPQPGQQQKDKGRGGPQQGQQQQQQGGGPPPQRPQQGPQQQQAGGPPPQRPQQGQPQQSKGQGGSQPGQQQKGKGRGEPQQGQQFQQSGGPPPQSPEQGQQQLHGGGPPQPKGQKQPPQQQAASPSQKPSSQAPTGDSKQKQPVRSSPQKQLMVIPARKVPGPRGPVGKSGRPTTVEVNQLSLNLDKLYQFGTIYHYDVAMDPDKPKRLIRPALDAFLRQSCPTFNPAFDGKKNLYSVKALPFGEKVEGQVTVTNEERLSNNQIEFKVCIKIAQRIPTNSIRQFMAGDPIELPQSAVQAIDIALRSAPLAGRTVPVGRSYFLPPGPRETIVDLGGGLELWYGFYQSAILNWRPYLNVDVAHKGFPKPIPLPELFQQVCDLQSLDRWNDYDLKKFKGFITTLKVDYEIPNSPNTRRTYRVNNTGKSAEQLRFSPDNGPEVTVAQYFATVKNYRLRYPSLPTVQVDPVIKNIFLPMELCYLKAGQALNRKLDEKQTAVMVRAAAKPPVDRKRRIMAAIQSAKYNGSPVVKEFGINVSENLKTVDARVLGAPNIEYKNKHEVRPQPGVWRAAHFVESKHLKTWFILNLDFRTKPDKLQSFSTMLVSQGRALGMNIERVTDFRTISDRSPRLKMDIINCLTDWKKQGAELVFVVLAQSNDSYSTVKQIAELNIGILTQCIKPNTMFRMNPATCGNILLKVNAKTNGTNHSLAQQFRPSVLKEPVMFVGIDVTHPSPDQSQIPSVAAVSASHDAKAFQYNMIWSLQPPREEIIVKLKEIMVRQLKFFYSRTGLKPRKIIIYRDGVSEGFFQKVLNSELTAIRDACRSLSPDYQPGITFLVVQKRHHIRFFPQKREDMDGKNENVPPGTIVDTEITHPRELDFYLVSHASLQGTSRPTKYHRLWDDNNISEDELEILTYYLCYLFSRCTRSVSYPAPTYYAHLAAYRARVYLENNPANINRLADFETKNQIEMNFMRESPMFFV